MRQHVQSDAEEFALRRKQEKIFKRRKRYPKNILRILFRKNAKDADIGKLTDANSAVFTDLQEPDI